MLVSATVERMAISRERQRLGYLIGGCLAVLEAIVLLSPDLDAAHAKGPMNTGHETVQCEQCHQRAPGTTRQQIQANVNHLLGTREQPADFGFKAVSNADCLACHDRPDDRHPVFRFLEPRFADARKNIGAHQCVGCHAEHNGVRVSNNGEFCQQCHASMEEDGDALHRPLVQAQDWESCLRCHDFHGNYVKEAPNDINNAATARQVDAYLSGGTSPYGTERHFKARRTRP